MQEMKLRGPRFCIHISDPEYPPLLKEIPSAPQKLYGIGDYSLLLTPSMATIGARKATPYGLACTERFTRQAAKRGLTIVSGGAIGCDQAAHRAALDAGGKTIVVFGPGYDCVYPKRGNKLFQEAIDCGGVVLSENEPDMPPLPALFVRRNRIIAGLARLLLIAEAGLPSGTFTTADVALNAGREIAVVPGCITSPESRGANQLIMQGAHPVLDDEIFDGILEYAFIQEPLSLTCPNPGAKKVISADTTELVKTDPVLKALTAAKYSAMELADYFSISPADLSVKLSNYELKGFIKRGYDGRYQCLLEI